MSAENREENARIISRRRMLGLGAAAVATLAAPGLALADEWMRVYPTTALHWRRNSAHSRHGSGGEIQNARYTPPLADDGAGKTLRMYNLHTDEKLNVTYAENGVYDPGALREVNYFFRDFRMNLIKPIDPRLLDLLHAIHQMSDSSKPFNLISGYRSPQTNAMLAARYEGVARHSMHIEGRAADINLPGRQLSLLHRIALALRFGGVGYYPQSDFVHVDTGRVRHWG